MNPNPLAWIVLVGIVPFAFFAFRRWSPLKAGMIVMLGSQMFLPSNIGIEVPILPDITKEILPGIGCILAMLAFRRKSLKHPFKGPEVLVLVLLVGAVFTMLTNQDPISHGPTLLPALTLYDLINDMAALFLKWFPPFYVGHTLVKSGQDLRTMIRFMVLCALIYSIPILVEIRMSPQMNDWIYGYHQSDFAQTMRFGGYRPKVFMRHGLNVALFITECYMAAIVMFRAKAKLRKLWTPGRAALYLLFIIVICKSTGAYFHVVALSPLLLFASPKIQRLGAIGFVVFILGYPMIRLADLLPVQGIYEWMSANVNEERALSLWFRMDTEGQILENTRERIFFGWGGYARSFEWDERTGEALSILDGYWTNELGQHGLWGFFCIFGLMLSPAIKGIRSLKKIKTRADKMLVAGGSLMVCLYIFDWIPNSSIDLGLTFMSGGVYGGINGVLKDQKRRAAAERKERAEAGRIRRTSGVPPEPSLDEARPTMPDPV